VLKKPLPPGDNPTAVNKYYYYYKTQNMVHLVMLSDPGEYSADGRRL
jgi:hypothetical protein